MSAVSDAAAALTAACSQADTTAAALLGVRSQVEDARALLASAVEGSTHPAAHAALGHTATTLNALTDATALLASASGTSCLEGVNAMSADWSLELSASWTVDHARERVHQILGGDMRGQAVIRGRMWIGIHGMIDSWQSIIEEGFGFRPTLSITYQRKPLESDDEGEYDRDLRDMALSAHALAEEAEGDSVFLFNGEELIFQRIDGVLTINADWSQWQRLRIPEALSVRHELKPLVSPLL